MISIIYTFTNEFSDLGIISLLLNQSGKESQLALEIFVLSAQKEDELLHFHL